MSIDLLSYITDKKKGNPVNHQIVEGLFGVCSNGTVMPSLPESPLEAFMAILEKLSASISEIYIDTFCDPWPRIATGVAAHSWQVCLAKQLCGFLEIGGNGVGVFLLNTTPEDNGEYKIYLDFFEGGYQPFCLGLDNFLEYLHVFYLYENERISEKEYDAWQTDHYAKNLAAWPENDSDRDAYDMLVDSHLHEIWEQLSNHQWPRLECWQSLEPLQPMSQGKLWMFILVEHFVSTKKIMLPNDYDETLLSEAQKRFVVEMLALEASLTENAIPALMTKLMSYSEDPKKEQNKRISNAACEWVKRFQNARH